MPELEGSNLLNGPTESLADIENADIALKVLGTLHYSRHSIFYFLLHSVVSFHALSRLVVLVALVSAGTFFFLAFTFMKALDSEMRITSIIVTASWAVLAVSLPIGLLYSSNHLRDQAYKLEHAVREAEFELFRKQL